MKKLFLLIVVIFLLMASGPGALAASNGPIVEFSLVEESEQTCWLEVSAKSAEFNVFQFALNFDSSEYVLVDELGHETNETGDYQENLSGGWLSEIGCEADNSLGYLTFAGFIMPGQEAEYPLTENGTAVIDDKGLKLYRFRFKRISDKGTGFSIATEESGHPYNEALPEGGAMLHDENPPDLLIKFSYPDGWGKNTDFTLVQEREEPPTMTRAERVKDVLIFQTGNAKAIASGKLKAIYPGETVTTYSESGVVYLPLRFAAEQMDARVTWQDGSKPILIEREGGVSEISIGRSEFIVDGQKMESVGAPIVRSSRTMVPADMLEAALDMKLTSINGVDILAPASAPWDPAGKAESELIVDIGLMLSPLLGAFTG